jgi:hypothetical protein
MDRKRPPKLRLGVYEIPQLMRQTPEVAQIVCQIRMVGTELALTDLDELFQIGALGAEIVKIGHHGGS